MNQESVKPKKKCKPQPYWIFALEYQKKHHIPDIETLKIVTDEPWRKMTEEERRPYREKARQQRGQIEPEPCPRKDCQHNVEALEILKKANESLRQQYWQYKEITERKILNLENKSLPEPTEEEIRRRNRLTPTAWSPAEIDYLHSSEDDSK
ncbi:uncharacterized protein LOC108864051 [Galendromus occidentalis]|uniref:Uncharacterized protein LOC108864051 n=1 Tax=Galendromus occidentalis TaxID=34638 RepID=A0AAJ7L5E0_9ACAR|nr:uncharacterized protein LOC108864051 [Galendromus occidentalis]